MAKCDLNNMTFEEIADLHNRIISAHKSIIDDIRKEYNIDKNNSTIELENKVNSLADAILKEYNLPKTIQQQHKSYFVVSRKNKTTNEFDSIHVYDIQRIDNGYKLLYITPQNQARTVDVNSYGHTLKSTYDIKSLNWIYNKNIENRNKQNKKNTSTKPLYEQTVMKFNSSLGDDIDYSTKNATIIAADLINDISTSMSVFNDLANLPNSNLTDTHKKLLEDTLQSFIGGTKNVLPEMIQVINKNADKHAGEMKMEGDKKGVWVNVSTGSIIAGNQMSPAEIYVHELLHGSIEFALKMHKDVLASPIHDAMNVYKEFINEVTTEDLMPPIEKSIDRKQERLIAEQRLEYLKDTKVGFHEFLVMSQTNEAVINVLKRIIIKKKYEDAEGLWSKLILLINKIYDFIYDYVRGNVDNLDAYTAMSKYINEIQNYNNIAVNELESHAKVVKIAGDVLNLLNNKGGEYIKKAIDRIKLDATPEEKKKLDKILNEYLEKKANDDVTAIDSMKVLSKLLARWAVSNDIASIGSFETFLNIGPGQLLNGIGIEFFRPEGDTQQLVRAFRDSDKQETQVEMVGLMANKVDYNVEVTTGAQASLVEELFNDKPTEEESISLTKGVLDIELYGLFDNTISKNTKQLISDTINILRDESELDKEIKKTEEALKIMYKNTARSTFAINQAKGLGNMMVTGEAHSAQLTNSFMIHGFSGSMIKNKISRQSIISENKSVNSKAIKAQIDKLSTLYALKQTDATIKDTTAMYFEKEPDAMIAIMNYDKMAQSEFKASENYEYEYDLHRVKGHHFKITANWISHKPALKKNADELARENYKSTSSLTYHNDIEMFMNTDFTDPSWISEGMITTNDAYDFNSYINVMKEDMINSENALDPDAYKKREQKIKLLIKEQENIVQEELTRMMEDNYTPTKTGLRPVFNFGFDGSVFLSDMDISVKKQLMENQNRTDNKIHVVMARTLARATNLVQAKEVNKKILDLAEADMNKNYNDVTEYGKTNAMEYVKIGPDETNSISKEIWAVMPRYMKVDLIRRSTMNKLRQIAEIASEVGLTSSDIFDENITQLERDIEELYKQPFPNTEAILELQKKLFTKYKTNLDKHLKKIGLNNKTKKIQERINAIKKSSPFIAVRRNLAYHYFGNRELTLLKNTKYNRINSVINLMKKLDMLYKHLVKIVKVNIVVRDLPVLIWNIVSNFLLAILQGRNPIDELKAELEGIRSLNRYRLENRKAEKLRLKLKSGNYTQRDVNELKTLEISIKENPVYPLIKAGLYTSATEDINRPELHKETIFDNIADKYISKLPSGVKDTIRALYITKDTQVFQGLLLAMQYSDFAARYSKYYHLIKHGEKKEVAVKKVLDNQINYGFNHGKILQWMNAHGLLMFTTFVERIQRVVRQTTLEKPLNVALAIIGGGFMLERSPIGDSIPFKNFNFMFHSPDDIVDVLLEPPAAIQILTGKY